MLERSFARPAHAAELQRVGHTLRPLEIVVVNTRAGSRYGERDYVSAGCGMSCDATMYLLERGIRLTGTDAWSWDAPFVHTAKKYTESKDASLIWEGHKAGRDIGYCHLEKLHNLVAAANSSTSEAPSMEDLPINTRRTLRCAHRRHSLQAASAKCAHLRPPAEVPPGSRSVPAHPGPRTE